MSMHVVSVLNQKGGSGKSTLATNLAASFQHRGHDVALVDADPQKTASEWASRGADTPPTYEATEDIAKNVPALEGSFDIVILDGAPRMTELATDAVKVADLVLIPVQPSGADLWAAEDILDTVKARQKVTDELHAAFVVSRAVTRTNLADTIGDALARYDADVLDSRTGHRVAYTEALGSGQSVLEMGGKAATEIENITDEVLYLLTHTNE
jgi:chromosome partitioning protein